MFLFPRREKKSPTGNGSHERRVVPDSKFFFSLFFFLPPSIDTARNRPLRPNNGRQQSKSTVTGRFRILTRQKQPQSVVSPDSERSTYRSASGPVHTAWYGWYRLVLHSLVEN
ncbi:hypothetical protein BHE74_00059574 [Ensete ventricosum]|nr:hypothetical protein BHE74_00059574 [Ensete ventricosum]